MTVQSLFNKNCLKYGSLKRQIGFQLLSANLVFAFVGVRQAQIVGCAFLKHKWPWNACNCHIKTPTPKHTNTKSNTLSIQLLRNDRFWGFRWVALTRRSELFLSYCFHSPHCKYDFIHFIYCQWKSTWMIITGHITLSAVPSKTEHRIMCVYFCSVFLKCHPLSVRFILRINLKQFCSMYQRLHSQRSLLYW